MEIIHVNIKAIQTLLVLVFLTIQKKTGIAIRISCHLSGHIFVLFMRVQ
jgi:hypothetical protein